MNKLLIYLVEHLSFLYEIYGAEIVASHVRLDGPNADLILKFKNVFLRLNRDRDRIFIDFGSPNCANDSNWYSINIVRWLVTETRVKDVKSESENLKFLQDCLEEIEDCFSLERVKRSEKIMVGFEVERAKSMFGGEN